jgi:hypothetical protein
VARRTGGSAGTAEDGAGYQLNGVFKNVAGTATLIGQAVSITHESQAAWTVDYNGSGGNVLVRVHGAANNDITWHMSELKVMKVSS